MLNGMSAYGNIGRIPGESGTIPRKAERAAWPVFGGEGSDLWNFGRKERDAEK